MTHIDVCCLLLAVGGAALVYWGGRRAFLRTNRFGVEEFPSYGKRLLAKLADGTLMATGGGLIGASLLILAAEYAKEWLALALFLLVFYVFEREWYERHR
jgi:hypothetical protein